MEHIYVSLPKHVYAVYMHTIYEYACMVKRRILIYILLCKGRSRTLVQLTERRLYTTDIKNEII